MHITVGIKDTNFFHVVKEAVIQKNASIENIVPHSFNALIVHASAADETSSVPCCEIMKSATSTFTPTLLQRMRLGNQCVDTASENNCTTESAWLLLEHLKYTITRI